MEAWSRCCVLDKLDEAQNLGLQFWQTKSNAIIVYQTVPPECISMVIHNNNMKIVYERLSDPQPAPKVVLKSDWLVLQQQQRTKPSFGQLERQDCKEEVEITTSIFNKIDLKIDGVPQSDILKDEEQMKSISEAVEKLQGTETNLGEDCIFTEEAADRIHRQRHAELVELRQTSKTLQCKDCLKHVPDRMVRCCCGYGNRPTQEFLQEIEERCRRPCRPQWKVRFCSRGMKHGLQPWQETHKRAREHPRGVRKRGRKRQEEWTTIRERWHKHDIYRTNQSTLNGWTIENVKYLDCIGKIDISYTATKSQRSRWEGILKVFCACPDHSGGPKNTRPNFTEAVETVKTLSSKEEWRVPDQPVEEWECMYDRFDPKVKAHWIWLSKNWASYFKETGGVNSRPTRRAQFFQCTMYTHGSWRKDEETKSFLRSAVM